MKALPQHPFRQFLLLAGAYYLAGRLALLLAIPPGYATVIWPAAGVGLAGCYLLGYRFWPAVTLGSALVNLDTAIVLGQGTASLLMSLVAPLVIGLGAGAQAAFGSYLLKRYIGREIALDDVSSVARFLLLGCGLSCLVAASVGTGILWLRGVIVAENVAYNWLTWWVGDGLGVMLAAVLIFSFWAEPQQVWRERRRILPAVILGTATSIVVLFAIISRSEFARQESEFVRRSNQIQQLVSGTLARYDESLHVLASAMQLRVPQNRTEFRRLVGGILERSPGFQGITWTVPVHGDKRREIEQRLSEDYGETLVITQLTENGSRVLAEDRERYMVIRHVEPLAENHVALGFDVSSNQEARVALMRATESRLPAATNPTRLVQETAEETGIVAYFPVFRRSPMGESELLGFVAGVFRIETLMHAILAEVDLEGLSLTLDSADTPHSIFHRGNEDSVKGYQPFFEGKWAMHFADREWDLVVSADQSFWANSRSPVFVWVVLAGGMLFTGLLGVSLLVFTGQHFRVKAAGEELQRTVSALRSAQNQLVEAEKMASLGGMVAGFAHELNTPIGVVITAISTLINDLERSERLVRDTDNLVAKQAQLKSLLQRAEAAANIVMVNAQKAAGLVTSFKQVSIDDSSGEVREINLQEYLGDLFLHLEASCRRHGHRLNWHCPKDLNIVSVPSGITQVIYNLVQNSLDHAYLDGTSGHLDLEVLRSEEGVQFIYRDDGSGIPSETIGKIFDPFFTTRRGGGGAGLGLHLVYNIVRQQLRGTISVSSEPGEGTVFTVVLPERIAPAATSEEGRRHSLI
jgi:signal transduction histidine kinase/integral membrane sensor domain MASE1